MAADRREIKKVLITWIVLISLNAVYSIFAALIEGFTTFLDIAAMLTAVLTFIVLYTLLDLWALSWNRTKFSKSLKIGASIKIAFQIFPAIEIGAGTLAGMILEGLISEIPFLYTYLLSMLVGIMLSIVGFVIVFFAWCFLKVKKNPTQQPDAGNAGTDPK